MIIKKTRARKKKRQENGFVRKGIRTPALIRGPEISCSIPIGNQGLYTLSLAP